jgi:hypothetical protein
LRSSRGNRLDPRFMSGVKISCSSITVTTTFAVAALLFSLYGSNDLLFAQELPQDKSLSRDQTAIPSNLGRLYVFREIRSFGAHIDDDVTINGVPVHRLGPGMGFYCDVSPGSYVVSVLRHKAQSLNVSVVSGQSRYVCVMLHKLGGVAPRGGEITSDQAFEVHQLEPGYGAQRIQEYRLTRPTCPSP